MGGEIQYLLQFSITEGMSYQRKSSAGVVAKEEKTMPDIYMDTGLKVNSFLRDNKIHAENPKEE